eukprot:tig00000178_g12779.t1
MAMVERDYPAGSELPWLEKERRAHGAFGDARRRMYAAPEGAAADLDAYAAGEGPEIAIVSGASGCGKSALLANWAESWRERHAGDFVLVHFVGGSRESARLAGLLRRVYEDLRGAFPELPALEKPMATGDVEEALAFCAWLAAAGPALPRRAVLVLDALDQLLEEAGAGAQRLQWLPAASPRLRIVVSCVLKHGEPGHAEQAVRRRPHVACGVAPLGPEQRRAVARAELEVAGKALSDDMLERLCGAAQAANPLFLLTARALTSIALHELRDAAVHATLEARLAECLACHDPASLFALMMRRWSQQYGAELVKDALGALARSRHGLAESELRRLLGVGEAAGGGEGEAGTGVTPLRWLEFTSAASAVLVDRDGLWGFLHLAASEAAAETFGLSFWDRAERQRVHRRLGEFFAAQAPSQRRAEEGPWQLWRAGEDEKLAALLGELDVLRRLGGDDATRHELARYWTQSGRAQEAPAAYERALGLQAAEATADDFAAAGALLVALGRYAEAEPFLQRALAIQEAKLGRAHPETAACLSNLATLFDQQGKYGEAEPLYKRALAVEEAALGPGHPDTASLLDNLGQLYASTGRYDEAETLMQVRARKWKA